LDHVANPSANHHPPIRSLHSIYAPAQALSKEFHLRPFEIDRAAGGWVTGTRRDKFHYAVIGPFWLPRQCHHYFSFLDRYTCFRLPRGRTISRRRRIDRDSLFISCYHQTKLFFSPVYMYIVCVAIHVMREHEPYVDYDDHSHSYPIWKVGAGVQTVISPQIFRREGFNVPGSAFVCARV